jgi:hypothetical protein
VKKSALLVLIGIGAVLWLILRARQANAIVPSSALLNAPFPEWVPDTAPGTATVAAPGLLEAAVQAILNVNPFAPMPDTLGERNNNPGNIRPSAAYTWRGQTGVNAGYVTFDTPENGIRAIAKDLTTKFNRGLDTVRKIISVWAPPSENDTPAYIAAVARSLNVDPDAALNLDDPNTLQAFVEAIIHQENERVIYTAEVLSDGIARAFA